MSPAFRFAIVAFLVLLVLSTCAGCVQAREAAYYNPKPVRRSCSIPICDGPCREGRVIDCTSPGAIQAGRVLGPVHP